MWDEDGLNAAGVLVMIHFSPSSVCAIIQARRRGWRNSTSQLSLLRSEEKINRLNVDTMATPFGKEIDSNILDVTKLIYLLECGSQPRYLLCSMRCSLPTSDD